MIAFTQSLELVVREFRPSDMAEIIQIYKEAFADWPWNEYMKCKVCGINYGRDEVFEGVEFDRIGAKWEYKQPKGTWIECEGCGQQRLSRSCKGCGTDLSARITEIFGGCYALNSENFVPYWSSDEIKQDILFALSQEDPIFLVAEDREGLVGFTWGYRTPLEKFPFLQNLVGINIDNSIYMDEIAVAGNKRRKNIGTRVGQEFENTAREMGYKDVVLRTDQRNAASMSLFRKLGFIELRTQTGKMVCKIVYDPEYPDRVYLWKRISRPGISVEGSLQ